MSVESISFDITLGCPVLGVTRKPGDKSCQKKDL